MLPIVPIKVSVDTKEKSNRSAAIEAEQRYYDEHGGAWLAKSRKLLRAVRAMARPTLPTHQKVLPPDMSQIHHTSAEELPYVWTK